MLDFGNNGVLIENASELPRLPESISELYLDFETSSNDPKVKSTNPWKRANCTTIGAAITWDDHPSAYFVHRELLLHGGWLAGVIDRSAAWHNHHVKYDCHVAHNDLGVSWPLTRPLVCTIALAKIFDSDRTFRGGYGLDVLAKELCGIDLDPWGERLKPFLGKKNKDYGRIPIDVIADYGCQDPLATRALYKHLIANIPEESNWVVQNEIKLTSVLVAMERRGLRIIPNQVKLQLMLACKRMHEIMEELRSSLGEEILPSSPKDCFDLLINRFGFPMIKSEKTKGEASFEKHILKQYEQMPGYEKYREVVGLIREYRSLDTHKGLFWEAWLALVDETGTLHTEFNQNMRTGRTSSKQPNAQQLDGIARKQIVARDGYVFIVRDYNQQEFRWMMDYLGHEPAIKAYNDDPKTDYHQWVADNLCRKKVKRKPAKTLNFTIGFGGGKNRVIHMLSIEPDVVAACNGERPEIRRFATRVYEEYHQNLPQLKQHQRLAARAVSRRGYVRTRYGRRLKIPPLFDYKGFNNCVQSTAADTTKEAMTAASEVFNEKLRDLDCHLIAIVHDEFVFEVPEANAEIADVEIARCLELPTSRCRVPVVSDRGKIGRNWAESKP